MCPGRPGGHGLTPGRAARESGGAGRSAIGPHRPSLSCPARGQRVTRWQTEPSRTGECRSRWEELPTRTRELLTRRPCSGTSGSTRTRSSSSTRESSSAGWTSRCSHSSRSCRRCPTWWRRRRPTRHLRRGPRSARSPRAHSEGVSAWGFLSCGAAPAPPGRCTHDATPTCGPAQRRRGVCEEFPDEQVTILRNALGGNPGPATPRRSSLIASPE